MAENSKAAYEYIHLYIGIGVHVHGESVRVE